MTCSASCRNEVRAPSHKVRGQMGGTCPGSDGLGTCPARGLMEQAWTAVNPSHEPLGTVGGGVPPAGPSLQGQQVGYALGSKVSS